METKETTERKKVTWEVSNTGILTAHHIDNVLQSFNLTRLDKTVAYLDMSPQQKDSFAYGVKQQLSDATARPKDEKLDDTGKREVMGKTFESMVDGTYLETTRKAKEPVVRQVWTMADFTEECEKCGVPVQAGIAMYTNNVKGFKIVG